MPESWTGPRIQWTHRPTGRDGGKIARRSLAERERALARAPLFAELSGRDRRAIARVSGIASYDEGATVVKEGARAAAFFVILEGKAKVVRRSRTVARLGRGDFFGEISLLDGQPRVGSVITEAPSVLLSVAGQDFRQVIARDARIALRMLEVMAARVRASERPVAD